MVLFYVFSFFTFTQMKEHATINDILWRLSEEFEKQEAALRKDFNNTPWTKVDSDDFLRRADLMKDLKTVFMNATLEL